MPLFSRDRVSSITKADLARAAGDWNVAARHYAEALTHNPERPEIWVQYGHALKESGRRLDAEAVYRRAIEGNPASADAHLQLAHLLKLQGRGEEAKPAYLRALALAPELADAHRALAELGLDDGQIAEARAALTPLPPRSPRRPSRITLADRARELGQWAEAARLYRQALDRNPRNAPIWVQYGHVLRHLGGLPAAETAYRRALACDPRNADSHLQLGHALKDQGNNKAAEAAYLRAFAMDRRLSELLVEFQRFGWSGVDLAELRLISNKATAGLDDLETSSVGLGDQPELATPSRETKLNSIYYITNPHDPATMRYRVHNYAEVFRSRGMIISTSDYNDENIETSHITDHDILILCRVPETVEMCEIVTTFRNLDKPVIYDIDDFVFCPDKISYLRQTIEMSPTALAGIEALLAGTLAMMRHCDLVTVSTFALKLKVEQLGKPAHVVPNTLVPVRDMEFRRSPDGDSRVRITYLSGTATHEDDFAVCKSALMRVLAERPDVELMIVGELCAADEFVQFGDRLIRSPLVPHQQMLQLLQTADINLAPLELANPFTNCKSELKVFEAALYGVPVVASPTSGYGSAIVHGINGLLAASPDDWYECLTTLCTDRDLREKLRQGAYQSIAPRFLVSRTVAEATTIYTLALQQRYRKPMAAPASNIGLPTITIVAPLYNKRSAVTFFLESLRRQSYRGHYEVILVDDCTPDDSVAVVKNFQSYQMTALDTNPGMRIRIRSSAHNGGNCVSRNIGIRESAGDVIIVVDADCMFNRDFLALHARAHMRGDCDVAIGPINLETDGRPPLSVLNLYEIDPELADRNSQPQDRVVPDSFVNCITRNFSIRRLFLNNLPEADLFDEVFGYSADPNSGFGWEDVEMGCRLYRAWARIKYLPETASIHVSHPPSGDGRDMPLRSLRNFRRLHQRYPDLLLTARQWSVRTYDAILNWARATEASLEENDDYQFLEASFRRYRRSPIIIDKSRPLKILTYRWHCAHQYELYRLGHDVTLARGLGTGGFDNWELSVRPQPKNARFVPIEAVDPNEFDVAILHFDENVLHPELCHDLVPLNWGCNFLRTLREWNIPKVAVCHGTPQFYGQYDANCNDPNLGQVIEANRLELVDTLGDIPVVCNSHQARREWGFRNGLTIWHGFSPHEFPDGSHTDGILSMVRPALTNRPHYNGLFVHDQAHALLGDEMPIAHLSVPDPQPAYTAHSQDWAVAKFQNYARSLGKYAVYFNPTIRSPMPRSRGEAMMAGLVSVSLRNHDVDQFIRNGENGFFGDTPEELADYLRYLIRNPSSRQRLSTASRRTALDLFNLDRYLGSWSTLLNQLAN